MEEAELGGGDCNKYNNGNNNCDRSKRMIKLKIDERTLS